MILTYFNLYAKAEPIRMALTHSKTAFTDNRVTGQAWLDFKASGKCNNGQVPVLEVDGHNLNQSEAILRFLGARSGQYPLDKPLEMWLNDCVITTLGDYDTRQPRKDSRPMFMQMFGDTPIAADDLAAMVEHRVKMWAALSTLLGDKNFFGGDRPQIADFFVCASLYSWERNTQGSETQAHVYKAYSEAFAGHTAMQTWGDRMGAELKDYLAARPAGTI